MKSSLPWFCLIAMTNASSVYAYNGLDAYREGNYTQAASQIKDVLGKDSVSEYYMGRMRLYGYGQLKNNTLAVRHFKQAGERGYLPAQRFMGRFMLLEEHNPELALYWFKKAADQNDTQAQMYCAAAYLFGVGTKPNSDVARRYYIAAARNGDSTAQHTVAQSFLETHHSANKKLGLLWLNKSLAQNNPEAQVMMSELYASGTLVEKDVVKARELASLAIAQGYLPAIYQMGEIARQQNELPLAVEWYTKAVNAHYIPAVIALSKLYAQEKTPLYDLHASFLWMLKAAQNGSSEAQSALSMMYKSGRGVDADEALAKEWQQKAVATAKISPLTAQLKAAQWLSDGKSTSLATTRFHLKGILSDWTNPSALKENDYNQAPQMQALTRDKLYKPQFVLLNPSKIAITDYYDALVASLGALSKDKLVLPYYATVSIEGAQQAELIKQLEEGAVLGDSIAQFELAQLYQHGIGVSKNIEQAIKYYQYAAAQQENRAAYNLGVLYMEGRDVTPDYQKGIQLLEDAAFKGNSYAQYAMANIYEQGYLDANGQMVVQPNLDQAMAMYSLAAVNGSGQAQYRLAELMVRDKQVDNTLAAKEKRTQIIKSLYQDAVANGVIQAALPLAFFNAMDVNKNKQAEAFAVAKKEAAEGNVAASVLLGLMYDNGIGVTVSQDDAVHWYQKAAANPVGAFALGTHLAQGTGVGKDVEKGKALLQQSADAGFSYANLNLAILQQQAGVPFLPELNKALALGNSAAGLLLADYYLSLGNNDEQMKQAREIYQQVAETGDKLGQLKLGYIFDKGLGGPVDITNAQKWYVMAAEQGQPVAQYLLGQLYQLGGLDKTPDYALAQNWYSKAQETYPPAAIASGFVYDTVDDDYKQALARYELAANAGDPVGQFNAGLIYEKGKGIAVDNEKAMNFYLSAAEQGHIQAMTQLASIYLISADNEEKALSWYKKAADLGDRDALYQLGLLSETGVATKLNYIDAVKYYKQAAEKGNANAKLALARMYQYGLGVTKDLNQALALYKELAAIDNAYAQYQLATFYYDGEAGAHLSQQGKQLLLQAQDNGSPQARKALQWLASQEQDRTSFIEPVNLAQPAIASGKSADLMYLDALNTWNRGDELSSRKMLTHILTQYPNYTPAKQAYEQLGQGGKLGAWG